MKTKAFFACLALVAVLLAFHAPAEAGWSFEQKEALVDCGPFFSGYGVECVPGDGNCRFEEDCW